MLIGSVGTVCDPPYGGSKPHPPRRFSNFCDPFRGLTTEDSCRALSPCRTPTKTLSRLWILVDLWDDLGEVIDISPKGGERCAAFSTPNGVADGL